MHWYSLAECRALATTLGDTPQTTIAMHLLQRGLARAYVAGSPTRHAGALVQATDDPGEPMGFGDDASVLWDLLQSTDGWFCVEVTRGCARDLGPLVERGLGQPVRLYDDVYYALAVPPAPAAHPAVGLLGPADLELLDGAPREVRGGGFGSTHALLAEGLVAAAVDGGRVVAIARTSARTPRHADIAVATVSPPPRPPWSQAPSNTPARRRCGALAKITWPRSARPGNSASPK